MRIYSINMDDQILENYIKKNIEYLKKDLKELDNLKIACFPIFAAVNNGIEFISGLIYGFKDSKNHYNSGDRFKNFIKYYMCKSNKKYGYSNMPEYIYNFLRNKITHEASIGGGFITENSVEYKSYHLKKCTTRNGKQVYIHPTLYRNEFLKALEKFELDYEKDVRIKNNAISNFKKSILESKSKLAMCPIDLPEVSHELLSVDGTCSIDGIMIVRISENE